jgi:hypothetical protein
MAMQLMQCRNVVSGVLVAVMGMAAAESYHVLALGDLTITGDAKEWGQALESQLTISDRMWQPAVRCPVDAYLGPELGPEDRWSIPQSRLRLAVRLKDATVVEGFVDLVTPAGDLREFPFKLDPATAKPADEAAFARVRQAHFARLAYNHLPGTAWFRHLAGDSDAARQLRNFLPQPVFADSFAVFSGGRAIAENLALDRELILPPTKDAGSVNVADIQGVTVRPIDWTGKLPAGKEVAEDALAAAIPVDQHALFVPSVAAFYELIRVVENEGLAAIQGFTVRSPFRTLIARYRSQMGLDLPEAVARLLPIKRIAVTGGDPFFPTGTDVAVLFETGDAAGLHAALLTTARLQALAKGAKETNLSGEGFTGTGFATPDRAFSAYILRAGDLVAVTNSPAQVTRLMAVKNGAAKALGGTDEFRFFRHRYPLAEPETGFVFLSDETIRRWAGPVVRIGASRRTRATAALMELTARLTEGQPPGDDHQALLGQVESRGDRVWSANFGTLGFLTPVAESGITTATDQEKAAYEQWRRGYEGGWAQVFDPIAVRLDLSGDHRGLDLTVLPLTMGSDYDEMAEIAGKAKLSPQARAVPAEARLFFSMAVDRDSKLFRDFDVELVNMLPSLKVNPLGWMGESVTLWLEDGMDLAMAGNWSEGLDLLPLLPLGLRVESTNSLKLALFLTGVKSSINSSAPDLVTWENLRHGDQGYVRVQGDERDFMGVSIFYAPMKSALLVALDEEVLKRAIDRELAGLPAGLADQLPPARHLLAEAAPAALQALTELFDSQTLTRRFQEESWKALPVLNEWHRRHPDADPVKLERSRFASEVDCPGGKGYRWNAQAMTMESVAYGHPAAPREDAGLPAILTKFANLRTGLEFEDGGLRARGSMGPLGPRVPAVPRPPGELLAKAVDLVVTDPERRLVYDSIQPDGSKKPLTMRVRVVPNGELEVFGVEMKKEDQTCTQIFRLDGEFRALSVGDPLSSFRFEKGVLQLPAELRAGAVHQDTARGTWEQDGKVQDCVVRTRIRVIGKEKVEVPAGVFEDCVRIETLTRYFAKGLVDGAAPVTHWYHPKVGLVKSDARTSEGAFSWVLVADQRVEEEDEEE